MPRFYHLARLWIELARQLHHAVAPDKQGKFGSRAHLLLIGTAVYIGTLEGRPMTATKLADYVGMPRATVIRRLRMLCRRGAVEKTGPYYRTPATRLKRISAEDYPAIARTVRETAEKLKRAAA